MSPWIDGFLGGNQGVPGDWVTGNRLLDVVLLPLIFAIAFPLLRLILKTAIFEVRALKSPAAVQYTVFKQSVPAAAYTATAASDLLHK